MIYGRLFFDVGLQYNPDALLICIFVNDIANTPTKLPEDPFSVSSLEENKFKKIIHALWPRVYTLWNIFTFKREHTNKTKTTDFISTITKRAKRQHIPQSQIDSWKKTLPEDLVKAINEDKFNGSILAYGLLCPKYWSDSIDISTDSAKKKWENFKKLLSVIITRTKQLKIETAVVLIPCIFQYDPKSNDKNNPWIIAGSEIKKVWLHSETEIQRKMRHWARAEDVPFLDLTPIFRDEFQSGKNFNFELDGHWNQLGHRLVAETITLWLYDKKVFSFIRDDIKSQ